MVPSRSREQKRGFTSRRLSIRMLTNLFRCICAKVLERGVGKTSLKKFPPRKKQLMFMLNQHKELCNFHYHEGNEDEAKGDQVHMRGQSNHTKGDANGCEEHECHKCDGNKSGKVERTVGEYTNLEERVFASHIVCLNDLAECENGKRHGATLHQVGFSIHVTFATNKECNQG